MNLDVLHQATSILKDKPQLRQVHGSAIISGDIHGDLDALERVIELRDELGADRLILLGDYVDRGTDQLEVVLRICEQILEDPKFTPLRGNHEDYKVCSRYGFTQVLDRQSLDHQPFTDWFAQLPLVAVSNNVFMAHGGIPDYDGFTVDMIQDNSGLYPQQPTLKPGPQYQICWNDPIYDANEDIVTFSNSPRGKGIATWGIPATEKFLERNRLSLIIRAHIALMTGSAWWHRKQVLSLFTSQSGPYQNHRRHVAYMDLDDPSTVEIIDISSENT